MVPNSTSTGSLKVITKLSLTPTVVDPSTGVVLKIVGASISSTVKVALVAVIALSAASSTVAPIET